MVVAVVELPFQALAEVEESNLFLKIFVVHRFYGRHGQTDLKTHLMNLPLEPVEGIGGGGGMLICGNLDTF